MNIIATDQKFLPYGILHYYVSGHSVEEIMENLLKGSEKCPQLIHRVDKRDVEFWVDSFQNGNFDMWQEVTYAPLQKLENLPVLHQVIHNASAVDQKTLRKVCKTFRGIIDTEKRLYDKVEIRLNRNSIQLRTRCVNTNKEVRKTFKNLQNGCEIIEKGCETKASKNDYLTEACADFGKIVEKVHTKVKKLTVECKDTGNDEERRAHFLSSVTAILTNSKGKINVEKLEFPTKKPSELEALLGAFVPGTIKNLDVEGFDLGVPVFDLSLAPNFFLHSPHFEHLGMCTRGVNVGLDAFAHIPSVTASLVSVSPRELLDYKNKIQKSTNFDRHLFGVSTLTRAANRLIPEWRRALEPFDEDSEDGDAVRGSFPSMDGSGDRLRFKLYPTIEFRRVKAKKEKDNYDSDDDLSGFFD